MPVSFEMSVLPEPQRRLWEMPGDTPPGFVSCSRQRQTVALLVALAFETVQFRDLVATRGLAERAFGQDRQLRVAGQNDDAVAAEHTVSRIAQDFCQKVLDRKVLELPAGLI